MQRPVDYPIADPARDTDFTEDELTYAAFLDRMTAIDDERERSPIEAPVFTVRRKDTPTVSLFYKDFTGALTRLGIVSR